MTSSVSRTARLALREIHDQTKSGRFITLVLVAALLTPIVIFAGARDFAARQLQFDALTQERSAAAEDHSGRQLLGRYIEPSLRLLRPPNPLSLLVRGFDGGLPAYWDFAPDGVRPASGDPSSAQTPESGVSLDVEFVIRIVLGLLAISLAADSLAGERESGTLYMLVSQPVRLVEILAARIIGGAVVMALAVLLVTTGAAVALGVFAPDLWSSQFRLALIGFGAVSVVYLLAMYACGLIIGAMAQTAAMSSVVALSAWLLMAVASVPTVDFMARAMAPTGAIEWSEFRRKAEFDQERHLTALDLGAVLSERAGPLADFHTRVASPDDVAALKLAWDVDAAKTRTVLATYDRETNRPVSHQRAVWTRLTFFSPGSVFFEAMSRLAGTGVPMAERWDALIRDHQSYLNQVLFDDPPMLNYEAPIDRHTGLFVVTIHAPLAASSLRQADPVETTFRAGAADARVAMLALAAYAAFFVVIAFVVFPRIRY